MKVLLLDNYDSFTYNLYHYLEAEGADVSTFRNDEITIPEALCYDALVLSPGPGLPKEAGILMDLLNVWPSQRPVLGVCLGMQAIVEHFGGTLKNLETVIHGQASMATHANNDILFLDVPEVFEVGHYHSWAADSIPDSILVTAMNEQNIVMAVRHKVYPINAVQFHPESVLTPQGRVMIHNWVRSIQTILQ